MKLYHTTWRTSVRRIRAFGLRLAQTSNWTDGLGKRRGNGAIYAFTEKIDAIRWAHKMEWEFCRASGVRKTAIVTIDVDPEAWEQDLSDPLTRISHSGPWLRTWAPVAAKQILSVETVTPKMMSLLRHALQAYPVQAPQEETARRKA